MGTLSTAALAARVTTIGAARAVLGKCSLLLHEAYPYLDMVAGGRGNSVLGAVASAGSAVGVLPDLDAAYEELRASTRSSLDIARAYVEGIYATIGTADPLLQDEEISAKNAARVGVAMMQTEEAIQDVEEAIKETYLDFGEVMSEVLAGAGATAAGAVSSVAASVAAGGAAFLYGAWPVLLGVGVLVVGVAIWRGRAVAAVVGSAVPG